MLLIPFEKAGTGASQTECDRHLVRLCAERRRQAGADESHDELDDAAHPRLVEAVDVRASSSNASRSRRSSLVYCRGRAWLELARSLRLASDQAAILII
jgi:hypothetical protein